MTDWTTFAATEPELAARARTILTSTVNCVLGTLMRDGSPRLSGIDPFFVDDQLWIGCMPDSRKGADLRRDPRFSLHAVPWESRRLRPDATDPGDADAKITGTAHLVEDDALRLATFGAFAVDRGFDEAPDGELFSISLHRVVAVWVADDQLVIDRWTADGGRKTIRRS